MQRKGEGGEGEREGGRQKYIYEWCEAGVSILWLSTLGSHPDHGLFFMQPPTKNVFYVLKGCINFCQRICDRDLRRLKV